MKVNKIKNRILFLSPTVQAGWESQSHRMDFEFIEKLGAGSFGTVHKVKHKKTGKIYALKEMKKNTLDSPKLVEHARTQVKIMYSINNPYIIKLYNHFEDESSIYLVLEFAQGGQLYQNLKSTYDRKFSQQLSTKYIHEICLGLQAIHQHKIMHRDIKPENILLDENNKMKIADFGWSHFVEHEKRTTFCGTLDYLAPEMLEQGHQHDYRVDIWSIGVLIYELCTGQSPFSSELIKNKTITEDLVKNNIKFVVYKFPTYLSKECRDLVSKILVRNPDKRPSIQDILRHPWFEKYEQIRQKNKAWQNSLKSEMKELFPESFMDLQQNNEFSKEQIYNFSRPESIINVKPKKAKIEVTKEKQNQMIKPVNLNKTSEVSFNQSKKLSELQLKITQLEMERRFDKEEIKKLKEENERLKRHDQSSRRVQQLIEQIANQKKTIQLLNRKIGEGDKFNIKGQKKYY